MFIVALVGLSGAGKSTAAHCVTRLACRAGVPAEYVSCDRLRTTLAPAGVDPFPYDLREKLAVYERVVHHCQSLLGTGMSVVVDGGLSSAGSRLWIRQQIRDVRLVWIDCPAAGGDGARNLALFSRRPTRPEHVLVPEGDARPPVPLF